MILADILTKLPNAKISGSTETEISSLCCDSRQAGTGALFAALRGVEVDGHSFIDSAVESGAATILAEEAARGNTPWVEVEDARAALSAIADIFHDRPSLKLKVAGVTGTNGKTTVAFLLQHILKTAFLRSGLVGTVHYEIGERIEKATHTTPESIDLQRLLAGMVDEGCRSVVMEVSSHALLQKRVNDVEFDVAIFTNLSRDHLDYHGSIEAYFEAKKTLFALAARQLEKTSPTLVINTDDPFGEKLAREFANDANVVGYGMNTRADFRVADFGFSQKGTEFSLEAKGRSMKVRVPLIGKFNIYNAVAAIAAADAMGIQLRQVIRCLEEIPQVPGRMESVADNARYMVFVDYAHTPDALENALKTVREMMPRRIYCVFGCGGNRDIPKRKLMGQVASKLADHSFITSDNPRKEDPMTIISDVETGFDAQNYEVVEDRKEAIFKAVSVLKPGDMLLIAGKGHEAEQKFADRTIPFDDRQIAQFAIRDRRVDEAKAAREAEREP
ncbi:MAG: UDP-N-acetylmuramoyl-L-alanyl-D-glutamate--2,6-diaminopimelate ligase [Verrucomicrobiota bacterium]